MKGSFRERAAAARSALEEQHKRSYETREQKGGGQIGSVFDDKLLGKLGISRWTPGFGEHMIDVIPFQSGENHPLVVEGIISEGNIVYVVDFWAHQRIGAMNDFFVCQKNTFRRPDPICTYIAKHRPPKEEWNKIKPARRCAYLVWVHDNEEEEKKGVQFWEVSHFFFEKNVSSLVDPKTGGHIAFSHHDRGKHVFFNIQKSGSFEDDTGKKRDSMEFIGFQFVERDEPKIPDEILNQSFSLDDAMIMIPEEKAMVEALYGSSEEPSAASEAQPATREVPNKSPLERAKERIAQEEQNQEKAPEQEKAEQMQPEPPVEEKTKPETTADTDSDDQTCPHADIGGVFGETLEQLDQCDDCAIWKACAKVYATASQNKEVSPEKEKTEFPPAETDERKPKLLRRR